MHTFRLTPGAATGPLVGALGALAAAALIAAAFMGLEMTTDPWDVPAVPRAPEGENGPIVLATGDLPGPGIPAQTDLQGPAPGFLLGTTAGELPDELSMTPDPSVTTLTQRERAKPAPVEEGMIEYVRKRVTQMVRQTTTARGAADRPRDPGSKRPPERTTTGEIAEIDGEAETELVTVPAILVSELESERVTIATTTVGPADGHAQPDSSTTSGSASPLV